MKYEELIAFRDNVAAPRMKEIIEKTEIPDGTCYLSNVEISFIDGRSWGYEDEIKADGLLYKDGKVTEYHYEETDAGIEAFVKEHKNCHLMSDAKLYVFNELEEMEIRTVMRSYSTLAKIFPEIEKLSALTMELSSFEWVKMQYLFEHGVEDKVIKKMTHNEYEKYLEELANKLHTDKDYNLHDFHRDTDMVVVTGFDLDKFLLSEERKAVINSFFTSDTLNESNNMLLQGRLVNGDMIYSLSLMLNCKPVQDNGLNSYFKNDEERLILTYCEGDISLVICDTETAYQKEVDSHNEFYKVSIPEKATLSEQIECASKISDSLDEHKEKTEDLVSALRSNISKKIMAREDVYQFSTGNKVNSREQYIGTVENVDEEGVYVFNERNPKNHQYFTLKLEDFKKWVDEGLYRLVTPRNMER